MRSEIGYLKTIAALALIAAVQCGSARAQCASDTAAHTGEATYYTFADGTGNCMYDASPADLMLGAMNDPDYLNSQVCGECVELTGPLGSVTIRIVDRCPECLSGDIDLSPEAFSLIALLDLGRVPISWHVVPCEVTGPIEYHFKDGSSRWWTAVQIRNHRNPIASVEYLTAGGTFKSVNRADYNYFVESGGMGPGPFTFRVTDIYGHVLADSGIVLIENGTVPGSGQFPGCDGLATGAGDGAILPAGYRLSQNYPNPWNPQTTIGYALPLAGHVTLAVYDAAGRRVALLVDEHQHAGEHQAILHSDGLASGVYYYTLRSGTFEETRKLILVR